MCKIISAAAALIIMMGACSAFASECDVEQTENAVDIEQTIENTDAAVECTGSVAENTEVTIKSTEASEAQKSAEIPAGVKKTESAESEHAFIILTIYDEDGYKLEDKEKIQIRQDMTMKDLLDELSEKKQYDINWEEWHFIINGKETGSKGDKTDLSTLKPAEGDEIIIYAAAGELTEECEEPAGEDEVLQTAAVAPEKLENAFKKTKNEIARTAAGSNWEFGNEWAVIGISRYEGLSAEDMKKYCSRIAAYVGNKKTDKLNDKLSSDNSRLVLSLTSLGYDPTDVNGHNLLKPLADMNYVTKQGLSGPVCALIAFDSHNYEIPKAAANQKQTTREGLVNLIVGSQVQGKGWDMSGKTPDVDMTCMVIQALTPYYNDDNPKVKTAIDKALAWLSSIQREDGSFCTDASGTVSSESQSQVIVALTGLGIDPSEDPRFVKGKDKGNSALDALMKFYVSGGGFKHVAANWKANGLATQQGYYALAAYYRFVNGESSLFDMGDITLEKFRGTAKAGDTGSSVKKIETAGKAAGNTRSLGFLALIDGKNADKNLIKESFDENADNQSAIEQQKAYIEYVKSIKLTKTFPWIYMAIGALALMGIVLLLRNRKTED